MSTGAQIWRGILWVAYAWLWLEVISIYAWLLILPFHLLGLSSESMLMMFWLPSAFAALVLATWIWVLVRRVSIKWPLLIALSLILLLLLLVTRGVSLPAAVIVAIGIGKLIIGMVGRGRVLAGSSLNVGTRLARPRGLVEHKSND